MSVIAHQQSAEEAFLAAMQRLQEFGANSVTDTWLESLCVRDSRLCAEVKSLLHHFEKAGGVGKSTQFLDPAELHGSRAAALHRDAELEEWGGGAVGQRIGDFVIIGQLGSGGMGIVFVAEQQRPRRTVALKVIRRSISTSEMIVRFEREAELLGRLSHPGIAQIFAAGVADVRTAAGILIRIPYIAMERIHGLSIIEHAQLHGCTIEQVVRLIIQTCDAIGHAHRRGIIHRDLKPANLLVTIDSVSPLVKILDFGVARAVGGQPNEESLTRLTGHGNLLGTPAYMSPEQIAGRGEDVGPGADIYAIAAILFQILTGRLPIDLTDCPLPEIARRVVENIPSRLGRIDRRFRGDLETIVAKGLEKDSARRYASTAAMGADLQSYLDGRTIEAKQDAWFDSYLKIVTRHRVAILRAVIVAALFFVLGWYSHSIYHSGPVPR